MKNIVFSLFSFLFCSFNLFSQISHTVNFFAENLVISEITAPNHSIYTKVIYRDLQHNQEIGYPELPIKYINLIIPTNQMVENISLSLSNGEKYDLDYLVYPVQPGIPTSIYYVQPEFVEPVYDLEETYPSEIVKVVHDGYFDGNNHIITLAVSPVQYVPLSNQIIFYSEIIITMQMESSTPPGIVILNRLASDQALYDNILLTMVDNPEDVTAYQIKPITKNGFDEQLFGNYRYVVITSNALKSAFNKFVEWKRRKGWNISVVTTEEILSTYSGDLISGIYDDAGKIRQFLFESYKGGTVFALLAGHYTPEGATIVPFRYGAGYDNCDWRDISADKIPADLYFADFSGDWEVDGDIRYGEPTNDYTDYHPEIFVGRLLCSTNQDVINWTEKVIKYEQDPGNGDVSYLTRSFMFESDQMQYGDEAESVANSLPSSFSSEIWKELPSFDDPDPEFPSGAYVIFEMNDSRYGLWGWFGHGCPTRVNTKTPFVNLGPRNQISPLDNMYTDISEQGNGLDNLNNQNYPAIVYSVSCDNTPFDNYVDGNGWWQPDESNLGEGFTVLNNKGGPAFLGNTRVGIQGLSGIIFTRFAQLLNVGGGMTYLGVVELISKQNINNHYLSYSHNLVGCPETRIWVGAPNQFTNVIVTDGGMNIIVNAGISGCDINVRSVNNGLSYNYTAENVNSYTFNTSIRPLIITVNKSPQALPFIQYIPFTAITGGTLTTDATLWGKLKVLNTITVSSDRTLIIEPNTILNFTTNSSLVVNGTLNAIGTETARITLTSHSGTTNSSWGTITLSGSGAAGSQIKYADIKYGTKLEAINTSNITIQYCNIENTYDGIRFNNSTGSILNNNITTNSLGHGIIAENASNITVKENVLTKTNSNRCGVGIYFGGGANGTVALNDIYHWDWGICAIWGSSPTSYSNFNLGKNNRIRNCNTGFSVYRLSYPIFGTPSPSAYMWNSLSDNSFNAKVGISYPEYESRLFACGNWWGSNPPNTSLFQVGASSYLYYNPYLTSDPWGTSLKIISNADDESVNKTDVKDAPLDDFEIISGIRLLVQNKIREAKDYFISYINRNPNKRIGYVLLYYCYNDETAPELISYFKSLPGNLSKDFKLLLSYLYLKHNASGLSKENNYTIISANPNTSLAIRAKLNNAYIALYDENNLNQAIAIFNDVMNKPELSTPIELQLVYDAITSYAATYGIAAKNLFYLPDFKLYEQELEKGLLVGEKVIPAQYSLYSNYPNPFNPTTTIKYDLPKDGFVEIAVFDILGRRIITLVNEVKAAGSYEQVFGASILPSGVYIYKIQSGSFIDSKKMILLK
jgi:hypothetical protein